MKCMMPIADWLLNAGEDVVECIRNLEKAAGKGKVSPHAFKSLEMIYAEEDFQELTLQLKSSAIKATQTRLQSLVKRLVRQRWWSWLLLHPELDDADIHPSRRMPCCFRC